MSFSVQMPALGESVTEGTVTRWLKQEGDRVEVDEPLLEVSTDKVDTEIPSPVSGVLLEIKAAEDETIEVGGELAVIGDADEADSNDSAGDWPAISSATKTPCWKPRWASCRPGTMSPTAYTSGRLVRSRSSVRTKPRSMFTPASS